MARRRRPPSTHSQSRSARNRTPPLAGDAPPNDASSDFTPNSFGKFDGVGCNGDGGSPEPPRFTFDTATIKRYSSSASSFKSMASSVPIELIPLPESNQITLLTMTPSDPQSLPDPTLDIVANADPRRSSLSSLDTFGDVLRSVSPLLQATKCSNGVELMEMFSSDAFEDGQIDDSQDEMYTVFEIIDDPSTSCAVNGVDSCTNDNSIDFTDSSNSNEDKTNKLKCDNSNKCVKKTDGISCSTPTSLISEEDVHAPKPEHPEKCDISSNYSTDSSSCSSTGVRRSSRIKIISVLKQRSKGHGLVKSSSKVAKESLRDDDAALPTQLNSTTVATPQSSPVFSVPSVDADPKPVKVKSRWRRSSEMEMGGRSPVTPPLNSPKSNSLPANSEPEVYDKAIQDRLDQFAHIGDNEYHCERAISKEAKKMTCDCFLTRDEIDNGELGCGEDCLNRLLMIECNSRCPVGDRCTNRRFQNHQYSMLRVINTEKKGLGIQAIGDISSGEFLMEYVGEVLNWEQFSQRAQEYSSDKNMHHYFMSLKGDAVIDATLKGNISRFINHSCDPNAETQKWTVNGDLRIGFFSKRAIKAGDEITFDYQFQRYGKEGLRCYCEAGNCRGWIGEEPDDSEEEDETEIEEESKSNKEPCVENEEKNDAQPIVEMTEDVKVEGEQNETKIEIKKETPIKPPRRNRRRKQKTSTFNDLLQDMDLEEEMKNLNRNGIKNQSQTLSLCRAMVRAKHVAERISLLKLLSDADLPCRRLFLDYRGLRLLAPWCENADVYTRVQILTALERLPVSNKTVLKETKLLDSVEKWLSDAKHASLPKDNSSDESTPGTPMLIDESTGLPSDQSKSLNIEETKLIKLEKDSTKKIDFVLHTTEQKDHIVKISKRLIDTWSTLQEAFKIPKKERVQLMKKHERQANENQLKNETTATRSEKERWSERYNRHDRDIKRPIVSIVDMPRKSQVRLDDRTLTPIQSMSKEERRKVFAARAAHEERMKRAQTIGHPPTPYITDPYWMTPQPDPMLQNYNLYSAPTAINSNGPLTVDYTQTEYMQVDYSMTDYEPYQSQYCSPQTVYPMTSSEYDYEAGAYLQTSSPQQIPSVITQHQPVPNIIEIQPMPIEVVTPQPIPSLVSSVGRYSMREPNTRTDFYPASDSMNVSNVSNSDNQDTNDVVRWTPVKLPCRWRSMKDPRGRTYYYHVKLRISQWIPPLYSPTYNSKDDDTTDDDDEDNDAGEASEEENHNDVVLVTVTGETMEYSDDKLIEGVNGVCQAKRNGIVKGMHGTANTTKKKRPGLFTERIISPRREEDIIASKLDLKRYKETKEKLRKRKELALAAAGCPDELNKYKKAPKHKAKKEKEKPPAIDANDKTVHRIKEMFTRQMARVMVHHLDPYRRPDCTIGRITNTADFKHLARKLTHFVMLKELKHCQAVAELECNDSVKQKAKEFVRKYMAKYGPVYQRPAEEVES